MRDLFRMVFVLTVICAASGLVLSFTNQGTKAQREYQLLKYVQEPSIKAVLAGYDNDPIKDRLVMELGKDAKGRAIKKNIFPARKSGELIALAYDSSATGYHGNVDVMVGVDLSGQLTGVSVMTHTETPGLGARVVEPEFTGQYAGLSLSPELNVSQDGGQIAGISGATISSRAVTSAVRSALELLPRVKEEVK